MITYDFTGKVASVTGTAVASSTATPTPRNASPPT